MTAVSEADAVSFVDARPRLLRIARRVLINPADADDVVQDAWVRWHETDRGQVRDPAAFLTTATTRLALNVRQSARVRRESPVGTWTVDPVDLDANPSGAAEQVDGVGRALGMLLERLSATERAVYVLREAFDYPHRRIAEVLELSEANVRQIVTRARRRLSEPPRWALDATAHQDLLDAFLAAAQTGELTALEQVLADAIEPARLSLAA
ncbi:sigma-70 family RNA polymerase sigma factor [Solirubrobacter ginsenosidimutans]|uniref:Sigma-70 family RNA polymerase sigma factor n=1 Tax=Solirubrobacter ginsenosidimutans TaxID=490573 RepID=A0A9X3MQ49_9ACTN|nr:sigma-70 family RNA polymerase sigma factor [Solirubrobacter ginsenosidimutans]MDA0160374.1 sigma-70 family RNA polymerase sigma factor [Solirubrobacter ginsenosidimutans]